MGPCLLTHQLCPREKREEWNNGGKDRHPCQDQEASQQQGTMCLVLQGEPGKWYVSEKCLVHCQTAKQLGDSTYSINKEVLALGIIVKEI